MNINWTGKQEYLPPKQKEQLDGKFAKIAKLLEIDGKGEKHARVSLEHDKNRYRAEVTLNYLDHTLVGEFVDDDQFTALHHAVERLEKQMLKIRQKRRDVKKAPRESWDKVAPAEASDIVPSQTNGSATPAPNGRRQVFRVAPEDGKPLTVDEALLMIGANEPYIVYCNSGTDRLAVLMRRSDGNFDLVEC